VDERRIKFLLQHIHVCCVEKNVGWKILIERESNMGDKDVDLDLVN
jgi:hypothetical protein